MIINAIRRCENLYIKKLFSSPNIIKTRDWKVASKDFSQKHIMGKKFFELGMLYKNAKGSESQVKPFSKHIADSCVVSTIRVKTTDKITQTKILDINPKKSDSYILFAHGGGMTFSSNSYQDMYRELSPHTGILVPEYRGYGTEFKTSGGIDLRKTMSEDIKAGYEYLKEKGIKDCNITLLGYCGGCTPVIELAKDTPEAKHLILMSPYVGFQYTPAAECFKVYLSTHKYSAPDLENMAKVSVPTSIIHTKDDKIIPFKAICALAEKTQNLAKFLIIKDDSRHQFNSNKIDIIKNIIDCKSLG